MVLLALNFTKSMLKSPVITTFLKLWSRLNNWTISSENKQQWNHHNLMTGQSNSGCAHCCFWCYSACFYVKTLLLLFFCFGCCGVYHFIFTLSYLDHIHQHQLLIVTTCLIANVVLMLQMIFLKMQLMHVKKEFTLTIKLSHSFLQPRSLRILQFRMLEKSSLYYTCTYTVLLQLWQICSSTFNPYKFCPDWCTLKKTQNFF